MYVPGVSNRQLPPDHWLPGAAGSPEQLGEPALNVTSWNPLVGLLNVTVPPAAIVTSSESHLYVDAFVPVARIAAVCGGSCCAYAGAATAIPHAAATTILNFTVPHPP
jgi:hypothetical protein